MARTTDFSTSFPIVTCIFCSPLESSLPYVRWLDGSSNIATSSSCYSSKLNPDEVILIHYINDIVLWIRQLLYCALCFTYREFRFIAIIPTNITNFTSFPNAAPALHIKSCSNTFNVQVNIVENIGSLNKSTSNVSALRCFGFLRNAVCLFSWELALWELYYQSKGVLTSWRLYYRQVQVRLRLQHHVHYGLYFCLHYHTQLLHSRIVDQCKSCVWCYKQFQFLIIIFMLTSRRYFW